ncbi:Hypothetical predicted protein [Mytilus galloprovincialis]|uniref:Uncharacterized protein n=1 Tax=Mytilus galloprovincialis TaxID=29158 RepID=A0A8B6DEK7_MYTGA|nr:Hypothetical predicted protein [Mytilus galloprovincialis]
MHILYISYSHVRNNADDVSVQQQRAFRDHAKICYMRLTTYTLMHKKWELLVGKKSSTDRNQQGKEIALTRFVQRLRYVFNSNKVVPFTEPGSRSISVSSVISNTAVISRNDKNKSRHLSAEERYCQTALNKPCVAQNSARYKSNRKCYIQRTAEETKEAKENQSNIGIQTCCAKFKDADKLLSGNKKTETQQSREVCENKYDYNVCSQLKHGC